MNKKFYEDLIQMSKDALQVLLTYENYNSGTSGEHFQKIQAIGYACLDGEKLIQSIKEDLQLIGLLKDSYFFEMACRKMKNLNIIESGPGKNKGIRLDIEKFIAMCEQVANTSYIHEKKPCNYDLTRVFIVHGRDDQAKIQTARFIEKLELKAIILHEQASSGKTIIEKIEEHTNVGFAIVLYTPCDIGGLNGDSVQKPRARQNVIFEHGYLMGKLGRKNVCALVKGEVDTPNDISGVVYIILDDHGGWKMKVAQELKNVGYEIDFNKAL